MADRIAFLTRPFQGRRHELAAEGTVTIGRDPRCDVVVDDATVAPEHCSVERRGLVYRLNVPRDSGAVRVNGRPAGSRFLLPGDVVAIGRVEFRFESDPAGSGDGGAITVSDRPGRPDLDAPVHRAEPPPFGKRKDRATTGSSRRLSLHLRMAEILASRAEPLACLEEGLDALCEMLPAGRAAAFLQGVDGRLAPVLVRRNPLMATDDTLVLPVDLAERAFEGAEEAGEHDGRNYVCAPITSGQGRRGVLYADSPSGTRPFSTAKLRSVVAVGQLVGIALEGAEQAERASAAEREARLQAARLLATLDMVSDAVLRIGEDGEVLVANDAAEELLGRVYGKQLPELIAPEGQAELESMMAASQDGARPVAELPVLMDEEGSHPITCRLFRLTRVDGGADGYLFVARR